jgi:nucleotide-binding universal stress UspA family protein
MQIYKKILVTLDCSPVDEAIIKHVAAIALQNSAKVYLLHVVHSHTLDQNRVLSEKASSCMETWSTFLNNQGIKVFTVIRSGEPDIEILNEIEGKDYDLVAMATHGHTFIGDLLFGSVSKCLKHKISIPLLLLKPEPPDSKKK